MVLCVRFGEWSRAGCHTELPAGSWWRQEPVLVNCTCRQLGTFTVLQDIVGPEVCLCQYNVVKRLAFYSVYIFYFKVLLVPINRCLMITYFRFSFEFSVSKVELLKQLLLTSSSQGL